ncbi:hypothetical protein H1R13_13625 [Streptomyces mexicanus]|uniref:Uncharacterized protein n=1 Tax=Streptomyces mexicanus TaxID=178566 RepID=A0A7X1HZC8_9ACTN|nr:hypothetical protein [Streptomyces mexicanus]MBC2865992.1 hypothetical protein [Streptomyces mexicanus]
MDYCTTCRRHLNGALVCPGCGAYAPDIAPNATADSATPYAPGPAADALTAAYPVHASGPAPTLTDGFAPAYTDDLAPSHTDGPEEASVAGPAVAGAAHGTPAGSQRPGRAARRRQRARWQKTQRRALVATAVALVGGGLTVASMDRHTADRAQAAPAAPLAPHTDSVDTRPARHAAPAPPSADDRQLVLLRPALHRRHAPGDRHGPGIRRHGHPAARPRDGPAHRAARPGPHGRAPGRPPDGTVRHAVHRAADGHGHRDHGLLRRLRDRRLGVRDSAALLGSHRVGRHRQRARAERLPGAVLLVLRALLGVLLVPAAVPAGADLRQLIRPGTAA